jgi:ketosteroid isomerase-like protein
MSRNVDTVKSAYAAFGRGDIPGLLAMLADDVQWEHDWGGEQLRWYVSRKGPAEAGGFFQTLADFDFKRFEPFAFLEGDGYVASLVHIELTIKTTGKTFKDLEAHLWSFGADGKVATFRHLSDTHQLAQATAA